MGQVWLASEPRLGRKVAVKFLSDKVTLDRASITRFESGARAASALNHPNVCHIYSVGEGEDSGQFIAMECVEELLGCPVRPLASWAGMALSREAWRTPLLRRDPILRRVLEGQADAIPHGQPTPGGIALDVRRALAVRLPRAET